MVFTADDPLSRPDPIIGQLQPGGTYYGLMPLVQATFNPSSAVTHDAASHARRPAAGDPLIFPLPQAPGSGSDPDHRGQPVHGRRADLSGVTLLLPDHRQPAAALFRRHDRDLTVRPDLRR